MSEPTIVFQYIERRARGPFPVQGKSGRKYGTANYDDRYHGHVFRMPLSEWKKCGRDISLFQYMPLCAFFMADVEVPQFTEREQKLMRALEDAQATIGHLKTGKKGGKKMAASIAQFPAAEKVWNEEERRRELMSDRNFREVYLIAKRLGVPRYSSINKKEPLIEGIITIEKAASTAVPKDGPGDSASASGAQAAA